MIEKNLIRGAVADKDVRSHIESLPDDAENAAFINLDELEAQKK